MIPLEVRCSSLDRAYECPASIRPPAVNIATQSEPARLGTAFHDGIARMIDADEPIIDTFVSELAITHTVDESDLTHLLWNGWDCWQKLRIHFPQDGDLFLERQFAVTSEDGPSLELVGTPDVVIISADGKCAFVVDWKTGRLDEEEHAQQVKGYGWLVAVQFPEIETVYVCVVDVRTKQTRFAEEFNVDDLGAWWGALSNRLTAGALPWGPGRHCGFCPRALECEARQLRLQDAVRLVMDGVPSLPDRGADRSVALGKLYHARRELERLCASVGDAIRAEVVAQGGVVPFSDDRELIVTQRDVQKIDGAAYPFLTDLYGAEIGKAVQIGKTKLLDAVRGQAPRGQKGAAAEQCMESLDQLGFVSVQTSQVLETRARRKDETEQEEAEAVAVA